MLRLKMKAVQPSCSIRFAQPRQSPPYLFALHSNAFIIKSATFTGENYAVSKSKSRQRLSKIQYGWIFYLVLLFKIQLKLTQLRWQIRPLACPK